MFSILLTLILVANIQPTTLGGYAPQTRIEDTVKAELVVEAYNDSEDSSWWVYTSSYFFLVDVYGVIKSIITRESDEDGVYVAELGIKFPCTTKSVLEVLGMPDKIEVKLYTYQYIVGSRMYFLCVSVDGDKATSCSLGSATRRSKYLPKFYEETK